MVADPLTKWMEADRLLECMDSNILDLEPTAESTLSKMAKQAARKKKKLDTDSSAKLNESLD